MDLGKTPALIPRFLSPTNERKLFMAHPDKGHSPSPALWDANEIRRALQTLTLPGQVIELRILNAKVNDAYRSSYQASGYFNDPEALVKALRPLKGARGVYITLQPCDPALLARAHNRLRTAD